MRIEELIGDLLLRHNCVVIPTFGGFVAGQTSASFDSTRGIVLPPRKSLLFNKQLINNDGLLIAAYAQVTKLSYDDSFISMQEQVQAWQRKLAIGERVNIERVGFLFLDSEKNIGFEQDRFNNLLLSSFGLGKVHFITEDDIQWVVHENTGRTSVALEEKETPIISILPVLEAKEEVHEQSMHTSIKVWKYIAAAVIALPICFYSYWIPMKTPVLESKMISIQDFNPFKSSGTSIYKQETIDTKEDVVEDKESIDQILSTLPSDVEFFSFQFDNETFMPVRVREVKKLQGPIPTVITKNEIRKKVDQSSLTSKAFSGSKHLIVGCFSTAQNANRLVAELKKKGFDAYIVDVVNGLHRVSASNSSSDSVLANIQSRLEPMNISTWILKK